MGYPIAGHLSAAGYPVVVYNRSRARALRWSEEFGAANAASPAEAAAGAAIIFSCVGNDDDLREVMLGVKGVIHGLSPGAVIVDHTTSSAHAAREIAGQFLEQGHAFIDTPVSGGQLGAESGRLTVMCGGPQEAFEQVSAAIGSYAASVKLLGASGAGQLSKMVNQICIAGVVQGLAEGLHFARSCGLDAEQVVEVISKGAAQSWQMDNRYQTMINGDYEHGFAVDWMRKDLGYVLQEARTNGSHLPLTALVDQFYSEVQALGGGRWDTSSLLARLESFRPRDDEPVK